MVVNLGKIGKKPGRQNRSKGREGRGRKEKKIRQKQPDATKKAFTTLELTSPSHLSSFMVVLL